MITAATAGEGAGEVTGVTTGKDEVEVVDGVAKDTALGVDYLQAGSVRRLLAERENVVAYGDTARIESIGRELKALGYKGRFATPVVDGGPGGSDQTPVGRSSGKPNVTAPVVESTTPAAPAAKAT